MPTLDPSTVVSSSRDLHNHSNVLRVDSFSFSLVVCMRAGNLNHPSLRPPKLEEQVADQWSSASVRL